MKYGPEHVAALQKRSNATHAELSKVILELSALEGRRQQLVKQAERDTLAWVEASRQREWGKAAQALTRTRRKPKELDPMGKLALGMYGYRDRPGVHIFTVDTLRGDLFSGPSLCGVTVSMDRGNLMKDLAVTGGRLSDLLGLLRKRYHCTVCKDKARADLRPEKAEGVG